MQSVVKFGCQAVLFLAVLVVFFLVSVGESDESERMVTTLKAWWCLRWTHAREARGFQGWIDMLGLPIPSFYHRDDWAAFVTLRRYAWTAGVQAVRSWFAAEA